jgi:hypothetical protein
MYFNKLKNAFGMRNLNENLIQKFGGNLSE